MLTLDELISHVAEDEEVVAAGMAVQDPVVVTPTRLVRSGYDGAVSISFDSITCCKSLYDAHRWWILIHHEPIDPKHRPGEASQWWRWHDRRRLRREWRETTLRFSSDHTDAARALRDQLARYGVVCQEVGERHFGATGSSGGWRSM